VQGRLALGQYVHTHLARTTDGGAHWEFVKVLNRSADGTLTMPDGTQLSGAWRYEVPSLVSDPADPDASRRWKLFVHRYFWESTRDRMFTHGWIALRTAADPAGTGPRKCRSSARGRIHRHPRLGFSGVRLSYRIILLVSDDHGGTWRFVRSYSTRKTRAVLATTCSTAPAWRERMGASSCSRCPVPGT
jgi:hypothetical protein